jgi:hypothetical protein
MEIVGFFDGIDFDSQRYAGFDLIDGPMIGISFSCLDYMGFGLVCQTNFSRMMLWVERAA